MACGLPTIASDVGGIPELIKEGETGFLVPPGDSVIMSERLSLLINNAELRNSMGKNAFSVARNLSIENQANGYLQWFHELRHDHPIATGLS
jgi:glycosyltransferase involved in cell wall biosynthesis